MNQLRVILVSMSLLAWHTPGLASTTAASLEIMMAEWLALGRQADQIRSDWQQQKLILSQRADLLRIEEIELKKQIQENSGLENKAQALRRSLAKQQTLLEQRQVLLTSGLDHIENQIHSIIPRLPDPLSLTWQRALKRLNMPSKKASVSSRLESYLSLLGTMDRFESKVTRHQTLMTLGGETFIAEQYYLGLGAAWFISTDGKTAGYGHGRNTTWEWFTDERLISQLEQLKGQLDHPEQAELVEVMLRLGRK